MRRHNPNDAPRAAGYDMFFCGHCPNVHVVFYDRDDNWLCHATISKKNLRGLEQALEDNDPNFKEREP